MCRVYALTTNMANNEEKPAEMFKLDDENDTESAPKDKKSKLDSEFTAPEAGTSANSQPSTSNQLGFVAGRSIFFLSTLWLLFHWIIACYFCYCTANSWILIFIFHNATLSTFLFSHFRFCFKLLHLDL